MSPNVEGSLRRAERVNLEESTFSFLLTFLAHFERQIVHLLTLLFFVQDFHFSPTITILYYRIVNFEEPYFILSYLSCAQTLFGVY